MMAILSSTIAVRVLGAALLFVMHLVYARVLDAERYGVLSYAVSLAGLLAIIAAHGWPTALVRYMAEYKGGLQWSLYRGMLLRAFSSSFYISMVISLLLISLSYLEFLSLSLSSSLLFSALLLPVVVISSIRRRVFQALHKPKASVIPDEIVFPVLAIFLLVVFSDYSSVLVYSYWSAAVIALLLSLFYLWHHLPLEVKSGSPSFLTRTWLAVVLPMMFGGFGQIVLNRTDVMMIGGLLSMEDVGVYSVALRIALLNTFILGTVNIIITPKLAEAYRAGNRIVFEKIKKQAILFSTIGAVPPFFIMFFWPSSLMGMFGEEYINAGYLLQILAVGQLANALTGASGFVLLMSGMEGVFAKSMWLAAMLNLIGNYFAIHFYGIIGAAVITTASVILLNGFQFLIAWRVKPQQ